jgi:hypothetical protein
VANSYYIQSCMKDSSYVYITGTVNGQPVNVQMPIAQWDTYPNTSSQIAGIEALMLAAYNLLPVAVPGIGGSYTA